ncbi:MAG: T9SS type A sorting domain-containing protein [Candidatus Parvibacillus calidus]|nr:MAG: T9SS type A sorting domain-containing protein [Candidatus Parvibacillus calidus]
MEKYCLRPPGDDKFTDDEISIRSQGRLNASISPNPFSQGIELHLSELNSGTLHITIFAMNGMVVLSKDVPVRENSMKYFLALDGLTSGIYYLQVQNEGRSSSQQLIKIE